MGEVSVDEAKARARQLMAEVTSLSLATCSDDTPWAASVFFTSDSHFNVYFVSDPRTQHGRDVAVNTRVAATINPECKSWNDITGLQLRGEISVVEGVERAKALALYLKKFPQVDQLFQKPQDEHEETIAERLKSANIYKITPEMIRVIDNAKGFGHREEFGP
jgi:uncharacterized protein YhbP (UPF0306 family)